MTTQTAPSLYERVHGRPYQCQPDCTCHGTPKPVVSPWVRKAQERTLPAMSALPVAPRVR